MHIWTTLGLMVCSLKDCCFVAQLVTPWSVPCCWREGSPWQITHFEMCLQAVVLRGDERQWTDDAYLDVSCIVTLIFMYVMWFSGTFTPVQRHSQSTESSSVSAPALLCSWVDWKMTMKSCTRPSVTPMTRTTNMLQISLITSMYQTVNTFDLRHRESKKNPPNSYRYFCQILTDFENSSCGRLSWKFAIKRW